MKAKENIITGNYHQPQVDGEDQIVLIDPAITAETDELDPTFQQHDPPVDPEEEDDENEDNDFLEEEGLEDDDYDPNHDQDDDLSLNMDDDELD
ncbi:hypothetical protein FBD94_07390 [Pedobacter hiemivivus]|uniref:Uncharacterized protein n=1 Tax=Pedobacter hiemivivus TaxID=2530454 RepID=A0A4U1GKI0_9SPHI|nr:hypothetical protein [Pedobacter hiemivivus]TKC62052.1 hypothetical protein FBD94_07390 [Pedobacter hiemivivus]